MNKFAITITMLLVMATGAAANGYVNVNTTSNGGTFDFIGNGQYWDWDIYVCGYDIANTDITNEWDIASSTVRYEEVGDGNIFVKVSNYNYNSEWYYYEWTQMPINGDGVYAPGGHRSVTVINSSNVTGYIEYPYRDRKAVFIFDTRHTHADLCVMVHNEHEIYNASVVLGNNEYVAKWTDEFGQAYFTPSTGTYTLNVTHENYTDVSINDLFFDADKSYYIEINMTDENNSIIIQYKTKEPAMNAITPQGYVNYFADRLRVTLGDDDKCAVGTLQIMSDKWGVYPQNLNVTLCSYNMTHNNITYTIKNYQEYECKYTISLIHENGYTEIDNGTIPESWNPRSKISNTVEMPINGTTQGVYLIVDSERLG